VRAWLYYLAREPGLKKQRLDTVAHACNPSYLGGRDQKDCGSRPAQAKREQDPISSNKLSIFRLSCHLSYTGGYR
jgi:hypothetical protein